MRASAIEVQLAAYGLTKTESTVDAMVRQADSHDHRQKIWALWALGLLGNRGVEPERVVQVLAAHLNDPGKNSDADRNQDRNNDDRNNDDGNHNEDKDEDARRWAVEGLALVGTTPTIAPLLETMRNDPSPVVREHAACSLAQSGMLSRKQRLIAVPQLIDYSADPALDAQTRARAFQVLADITKQHLPNDSAAWRSWYQNRSPEN
ncbi:MAG: HEAT repeat domain-containing protein [Candidatus Sulfotelmatobacter sp.]